MPIRNSAVFVSSEQKAGELFRLFSRFLTTIKVPLRGDFLEVCEAAVTLDKTGLCNTFE